MAFIINPYIFGASGYTVSNSVVLNRASSEYFNRTHDASNRDTWTFSTWFKLGDAGSNEFGLFSGGADMNNCSRLVVDAGRNLKYQHFDSGGTTDHVGTTQVFRDTSAFYHVVLAVDTTQAVEANRIRIYVNGSEVTSFGTSNYPAQNADTDVNTADVHLIGSDEQPNYFSGYLAETVFIDGAQLAASSFGETNEDSGIWVPIDVSGLTFGTNGFHLNYSDSSALGADTSGNSNNFTVNTLVAADQVEDSPNNDADNNIGNYPTWNSILECPHSFADGSLTASVVYNGSTKDWLICTVPVVGGSGIYYWETKPTTISGATDVSLIRSDIPNNLVQISGSNEVYGLRYQNSNKQIRFNNAVIVTATNGYSAGDVIGTLLDSTNGRLYFSINDSWQDGTAGGASSGTVLTEIQDTTNTTYAIPTFVGTVITGNDWFPGADNPHSGTDVVEINFGQKAFAGTMPSNAKRLMTANLPELATTKPTDYFAPVGYTGNATDDRAIAVGFQPDFTLIKNRDQTDQWRVIDSLRGATKNLAIKAAAENTEAAGLKAFTSTGFTLGTGASGYNDNTEKFVSYSWLAGGAPTADNTNAAGAAPVSGSVMVNGSANTDNLVGTKAALKISANTSSGFSIVRWDSSANAAVTIDHKLGKVPKMYWVKAVDQDYGWYVYCEGIGNTHYLLLHDEAVAADQAYWNDTTPTSTVFSVSSAGGLEGVNHSGKDFIAYLWADVEGFSKIGSYTGNNNHDGPFIYTGFKPSMFFIKRTDTAVRQWNVYDDQRSTYNPVDYRYWFDAATANASNGEGQIDFLSNGVKIRDDQDWLNANNSVYIFAAWARSPFASNNKAR